MNIKQIFKLSGALGLGFFMLLGLWSCEKDPSEKAIDIVRASVEVHGGLENWKSIKELSFTKTTTLFYEDGTVESKVTQRQSFSFRPGKVFKIGYQQDSLKVSLISDNGYVHKRVNGMVVDDSIEVQAASRAIKAASYVVSQPFELLSEGSELKWAGREEVNGKMMDIIEVSYASDGPDADKWSYYIDAETRRVMANKVVLSDHSSWVENLTFDQSTDFLFNAHRKSYRLDENGEKIYLRAEYFYTDFNVRY